MVLRSMTGYGRCVRRTTKVSVTVEVRTVNARHLTLRIRTPGEWVRLEPRIEAEVRKRLHRGAVDVFVRVELLSGTRVPKIDMGALNVYRDVLADLGQDQGAAELFRLPGVVTLSEPELPVTAVERAAVGALREALDGVEESRGAEGARLTRVLLRESKALVRHLGKLGKLAPAMVRDSQEALRRRTGDLLEGRSVAADDPSLMRELALLADRSDVTEEIDRLASHLVALEARFDGSAGGAAGRELDFLLQEVGREVNTIGSKCSGIDVTNRVVAMKGCVERLREQVANIE